MYIISVTTLAVITSTAVTQTLTINNTNTIVVTASLLTTTSFNVMNGTAVLPTTTHTSSVSSDVSTGFVYEISSTVIVEVTDTQYTAVLVMTTSVLATDTDSSIAVVVRPTEVPSKTSSVSSSTIGIIVTFVSVTLGIVVFMLCLVIYFVVVSTKKRREKSYRINHTSQIGDVTLLSRTSNHHNTRV